MNKTLHIRAIGAAALASLFSLTCQAGEVYGGVGLPGVFVGYAHAPSDQLMVRADYATLGSLSKNGEEEGVEYRGHLKVARLGTFVDYFPWEGGFRLTGGLTFNQIRLKLDAQLAPGTLEQIGSGQVLAQPGDYFRVRVKVPEVTPYLGIGWGHGRATGAGWRLHADLGASIGKAKVRVSTNLVARGAVSQADIDEETRELREGVAKLRVVPQISLGVSYTF